MGEIADYYFDIATQQEGEMETNKRIIKKRVSNIEKFYLNGSLMWKTKDGTKIPIQKMSIEHIENTINFLNRGDKNCEITNKWIEVFGYEIEMRNEK